MPAGYGGPGDLAYPLANFGQRLGGYLLDALLYGLLIAALMIPGGIIFAGAYDDCVSISDEIICPEGSPDAGMIAVGVLLMAVGFLVVAFLYLRSLGATGQTWGRKIVGVKVVDASLGTPIGFGRALGRQLFAGFISSWIFYLGFLWMLWDDRNQTWHDKVVSSVVVST
jgi:uncharacterized RDD family membrane protein YckC